MTHFVVVGGGPSGLAAAHRLLELDPKAAVTVLEAAERAGGALRTTLRDGFVVERGPDSIISDKPWAIDLARRLGLDDQIVSTIPENRGAYVVAHGRLERIPEGFSLLAPVKAGPFLRSPILSAVGKARAGLDLVLPRRQDDDESLASFVRRRFGRELFDRLAQPLASGIYGADPELLSLKATMPRFLEVEDEHRSVALGLLRRQQKAAGEAASGARYGLFINFRLGSEQLVDALLGVLGDRVRTHAAVRRLERSDGGFRLVLDDETIDADRVILAVAAHQTARLLEPVDPGLTEQLGNIAYGSAVTVTFAWPRDAIEHPLDAYGFVVPTVEHRRILASTWASRKWPGRAPEGKELIRVFLGGVGQEDVAERPDASLIADSRAELESLIGARGEPDFTLVDRYRRAMPHYHIGHLRKVEQIEARVRALPGLELAGNAYRGVGIPDAVRSGERAAEALVEAD